MGVFMGRRYCQHRRIRIICGTAAGLERTTFSVEIRLQAFTLRCSATEYFRINSVGTTPQRLQCAKLLAPPFPRVVFLGKKFSQMGAAGSWLQRRQDAERRCEFLFN